MIRNYLILGVSVMILFAAAGHASVMPKPEKIDKQTILNTDARWEKNYMDYRVDEGFLDTLKSKVDGNLKIAVYLGTWCGDSRNNVPVFIKIMEELGKDHNIQVDYYNVQRKPNPSVKYFFEDLKVERVPTFIFFRDGKEIGRIVENPKNSLIEDFLEIIF